MTDHSVGINKMVDNDIREVAKQAARILIDGKPSRVVPKVATSQMENAGLKKREHMPGSIYREMLAASDPALTEAVAKLHDATENLIIAIGMGWDLDGVVEVAQAALARITVETSDG
jgi:thiamine pyrophosphate-dependent acetolactate synthase large subunit-like protein